jgi:hypothetical protein
MPPVWSEGFLCLRLPKPLGVPETSPLFYFVVFLISYKILRLKAPMESAKMTGMVLLMTDSTTILKYGPS